MKKTIDIILAYGLDDHETRAAVASTVAARGGDIGLAALDYIDANPRASLRQIERAIRAALA